MPLPGGRSLDFSGPPLVMAIVNCTGDSFYPPSRARGSAALEKALAAVEAGAALVDFGGESTRPGSSFVEEGEELERVVPTVAAFRRRSPAVISVDTRKAAVARAALAAGADIINDISALEDDPALGRVCAEAGAALVLMHKQGSPADMQKAPRYGDVVAEVGACLARAAARARAAGVPRNRIILDPGIGFGKRLEDNLGLLAALPALAEISGNDYPLLIGLSRKSFIGELTGRDAAGRLAGTIAANAAALLGGADIIRVHDPEEAADLVKVIFGIKQRMREPPKAGG
jgi:dihydropteroate synthase